ncbi:MAG: YicC/YloC family endoribonuclease [Bacteroidota bacterium]|nr:YicC/YloC family endoribonuclease [Bacteroidota bacterium]
MLKSMTGFGKAECEINNKKISIEIKSLNSKNIDIYTKIRGVYKEKELYIRNLLSKQLERGKVEFSLFYETINEKRANTINTDVVTDYIKQLQSISEETNLNNAEILASAMRLPDVLSTNREELDNNEWAEVNTLIESAIKNIIEFRNQEGIFLQKDITQRIINIESNLKEIEKFESQRIEKIKQKLKDSIKELNIKNIDNERFEQEIIYYLEKLDITEEKVRLTNHCKYFTEMINEPGAIGKKLAFISQEIGREINTIGSKANDYDIQKIVVLMKDELEKIKEQVLNIL